MLSSFVVAALMAQAPAADAAVAAPAEAKTSEQRNLEALEKVAAAADKLAAAAERLSPPPPAEAAKEPARADLWDFTIGAGATWLAGNTASVTFAGSANAIRKAERTIFTAKVFGGYGEKYTDATATDPAKTEVLLYNVGATAQFDYRFNKYVSAFLGAGADTDHVKSVEFRGYGDLGVGVVWLDDKVKDLQKLYLKTDLALRVQPELRFQYYDTQAQIPDVVMVGPRVAVNFRYAMAAGTFFTEDAEFLPNVLGAARVQVNSTTKLGVSLAAHVSVTAGFVVKYDSNPADSKKSTDTQLLLGLEAAF